jgi:dTDP-4-amino-4,6-dideoxy-D-galactose acyltransferase
LKELTKDLYQHSRYYYDARFDRDKINEFYSSWIEKAVLGEFDSYCYCLFDTDSKPLGFCSVRENADTSVSIGLFGIDEAYHGKGFGRLLVHSVLYELSIRGIRKVSVVTQGRNYVAQILYQKCGFVTKSTELWYHKWLNL